MQFEQNPSTDYKHGLIFESEEKEVEPVAATYRELVDAKARNGDLDGIQKHERDFSMWDNSRDRAIHTNEPLQIAALLEAFHRRTKATITEIAINAFEPAFDSDAIARRIELGEKAFQLAGLINLEFDAGNINRMLDAQGVKLFVESQPAPEQPPD